MQCKVGLAADGRAIVTVVSAEWPWYNRRGIIVVLKTNYPRGGRFDELGSLSRATLPEVFPNARDYNHTESSDETV